MCTGGGSNRNKQEGGASSQPTWGVFPKQGVTPRKEGSPSPFGVPSRLCLACFSPWRLDTPRGRLNLAKIYNSEAEKESCCDYPMQNIQTSSTLKTANFSQCKESSTHLLLVWAATFSRVASCAWGCLPIKGLPPEPMATSIQRAAHSQSPSLESVG